MTEFMIEYRPVRVSQRIIAAAMANAFVPIAALLGNFAIRLLLGLSFNDLFEAWNSPFWSIVFAILSITSMSFIFSWIGFLFLVPITHRNAPERFLSSWLATTGAGGGIGLGMGLILSLILGAMGGAEVAAFLVPVCIGYGAFYALVYWGLLRIFFVRRLPPVDEVFA